MSDPSSKHSQKTSKSKRTSKADTQEQKTNSKKRSKTLSNEITPQKIMDAFEGGIKPVSSTMAYRLCAVLVSVVMILLPLIYVGIVGFIAWSVYSYALNAVSLFGVADSGTSSRNQGRGLVALTLLYLAPIAAGIILVLFMLKPLFSRPGHSSAWRSLKREKEPLLFLFVDHICDTIGAPRPVQINLDNQVNASAGFRRGWLSMLSDDLVLTIGMPLVAGLSLRQFTGVLAHEFGHFSQGAGMRLSFIIRSINIWFARVVYERDEWDDRLVGLSESLDMRISWILYLAQFFIWITRKILWVLMMFGHFVSGFLMRQMEFDADRYAARLVGSRCFATTHKRIILLGVANQGALSDLNQFYAEGRLVDNLPVLININLKKLPTQVLQKVKEGIQEEETGWFDTHPATMERVESTNDENAEGVYRLKAPATVLFSDFKREAKYVTRDFYLSVFGKEIKREDLHSVDELLIRQEEEQKSHRAVQRYYQGAIYPNRPLSFSEDKIKAPTDVKQCIEELKSYRENLLKYRSKYKKYVDGYRDFESKSLSVNLAAATLRAKIKLKSDDKFLRSLTNFDKVIKANNAVDRKKDDLRDELEKYESLIVRRLERALQLFQLPKVKSQIPESSEWETELETLLSSIQATNSQIEPLWELYMYCTTFQVLLHYFDKKRKDENYRKVVVLEMEKMEKMLNTIHAQFEGFEYPFEHIQEDISIADFVLSHPPEPNNPGDLLSAAETVFENLMGLNHRALGRLCLLAEQVEKLIGLEILPDYKDEDDESED